MYEVYLRVRNLSENSATAGKPYQCATGTELVKVCGKLMDAVKVAGFTHAELVITDYSLEYNQTHSLSLWEQ